VKALPRPSKKYGETVCCAGVTLNREWKRLYPVRFRQLSGDQQFRRWQFVEFKFRSPTTDRREESCHLYEDSIVIKDDLSQNRRFDLIDRMIVSSAAQATANGTSLAVIRPKNTRFISKRKSLKLIDSERDAYREASRQQGLLDTELASFTPSSYEFAFSFEDKNGRHLWRCGDWETHATFFKWRKQYGEIESLRKLSETYNDIYPKRGMVFAIGNMAKRPQTWQLLGVIRLDAIGQLQLI
jgi:hypothetical protein